MVVSEKEVLRWLDGWRELALMTRSLLLWRQPSYPFALLGAVTLLFVELAYLEPRVVTVMCGVGLCCVLLDFAVPRLSVKLCREEEWNTSKQAELDMMARDIAHSLVYSVSVWNALQTAKQTNPSTYYMIVVPGLFIAGWIGSQVNNLFITYLAAVLLVMLPGLYSRGLLDKYYRIALEYTVQAMRSLTATKVKSN